MDICLTESLTSHNIGVLIYDLAMLLLHKGHTQFIKRSPAH